MNNLPTLSVVTHCSDPKSMDFPFREVILSALPVADEIVAINGDNNFSREFIDVFDKLYVDGKYHGKISFYYIPWQEKARKNASMIQRSNAIFQATKDYILLLDGDEILHEKDYSKIKLCLEKGYDAYTFKVNHFYRDYNHVKNANYWYKRRPYLFKNNLGIFDGYRSWLNNGKLVTQYTSDLITWDYKPVMDFAQHTSIEIFHYGYVREPEIMLKKHNNIELRHHPDGDTLEKEWQWDMNNTVLFSGTHPKVMRDRIKNHKQKHEEYYND